MLEECPAARPTRRPWNRLCALLALAFVFISASAEAATTYSLGASTIVEGPDQGKDSVVLSVTPVTGAWTATTTATWLHFFTGASGTGDDMATGTGSVNVLFSFDANTATDTMGNPISRTGTLTIGGQTLTITQAPSNYVAAGAVTPLLSAGLSVPQGVAVDSSGNVYISDSGNGAIKEWSQATQSVTSLITSGLSTPKGVAVDASGNVYFADSGNNAIKEWFAATQSVTTLVSTGLNDPAGVAVDSAGNVYIADSGNNAIKEWSAATQTVSTLVATGLNDPTGVAVDAAGNVYIADTGNNAVEEYTATAATPTFTTVVSAAKNKGLTNPAGVAVDGLGNVYITNTGDNAVLVLPAAATVPPISSVTTLISSGISGPIGVAVDGLGNCYLADTNNSAIKELPRAFLNPTAVTEPETDATGGTDQLPAVLPTTVNLLAPFAPTASQNQTWLTIGTVANGVIKFAFTANTTSANRTASINVLGQQIAITDPPEAPASLTYTTDAPTYAVGVPITIDVPTNGGGAVASYSISQSLTNCSVTNGSAAVTCDSTASLVVGAAVTGADIPAGATIAAITSATTFTLSKAATSTTTGLTLIVSGLPPGLTLNTTTGTINGTPTAVSGPTSFTITATNAGGTTTTTLTLTIVPECVLGTTSLAEGPSSGADSVALTVTPAGGEWTATTTTSWLHISTENASGTGSANVQFTFDANTATGSTPAPTRTGTIAINTQTLTITQGGSNYVAAGPGAVTALVFDGLSQPAGVALDSSGNVYIADSGNNAIKQWVPATQILNRLAATGLDDPTGLAVDASGNVYFSDTKHKAIDEWLASTKSVKTLISTTYLPYGLAVDGSANLYIAAGSESQLVERTAAGGVSTLTAITGLKNPTGVAVDGSGNLYIADTGNSAVKEYSTQTQAVTTLVTSTQGNPTLLNPGGVAVDGSGNVYIADTGNSAIKEWSPISKNVATLLSTGLKSPGAVAVDSVGDVYIADTGNSIVKELPRAFLDLTAKTETAGAGTDTLPTVLPTTTNLLPPFAPTSSQSWLTIGTISNGVINFSFTANTTNASRTATITVLGQPTVVTQTPEAPATLSYTNITSDYGVGEPISLDIPSNTGGAAASYSISQILPNCSVTIGSAQVTCQNTSVLAVGASITGPFIPAGDTIATINNSSNSFTLSQAATNTGITLNASQSLTHCSVTLGSPQLTCGSTASLIVGDSVTGMFIPAGATIATINNTTSFTLSAAPVNTALTLNASQTLADCSVTLGNPQVTCDSTASLIVGDSVTGTDIPAGATIATIDSSTTFTLSMAATNTATGLSLNISQSLTDCMVTNGNPQITCDSTGGLVVGASVTGTFIPAGATVASIVDSATFTLSTAATDTATALTLNIAQSLTHCLVTGGSSQVTCDSTAGLVVGASVTGTFIPAGATVAAIDANDSTTFTLSAAGTSTATGLTLNASALPAGLSFNSFSGVLSGTPAALTPTTQYLVTATNAGGSATATLTITIVPSLVLGTNALLEGPNAGKDSVVLAVNPSTGAWTATTTETWLHVATDSANGTGSSLIELSFDANTGPTRSGTITVEGANLTGGGTTLTVTQAGSPYIPAGVLTALLSTGLKNPAGAAVGGEGNVYFADSGNNAVKEWSPSTQMVSALVSTGLNNPTGVALDASGNVYIADTGNNAVEKYTPANGSTAASVTTLVSRTQISGATGAGVAGLSPAAVAVDENGNVYIADAGNNAIEEYTPATSTTPAKVTTLVTRTQILGASGNGGVTGLSPTGVAVDVAGNVYFADAGNNTIDEYMPATITTTSLPATVTLLVSSGVKSPMGVAVDGSGNVYIADTGNSALEEWSAANQTFTTLVASGLSGPRGVAVDSLGNLYIADTGDNSIRALPRTFVNPTTVSELAAAGADALPQVLPATENLLAPFAPSSNQSWLTIGTVSAGVIDFSFTANATNATRTGNITVFGQQIPVTQIPEAPVTLSYATGSPTYAYGQPITTDAPTLASGAAATYSLSTILTNCSLTMGSTLVSCNSTAALVVGASVTGTDIPAGATVSSIVNSTSFNLTLASTVDASGLTLNTSGLITNCSVTIGSTLVTCDSTASLVEGAVVTGMFIPAGSTIATIVNSTSFTLSNAAANTGITLNADQMLANCSVTNGSPQVTCDSTASLVVGASVTGTDIPAGATVATITNSTTFALNTAATNTATGLTLNISQSLTHCLVTNGNAQVTCDSTAGLVVGASVTGTFIPAGDTVATVVNSTTFTLNTAATNVATGLTLNTSYLPTGLAFSTTTGQISGTPTPSTVNTTATYQITATNSSGTTSTDVTITILPAAALGANTLVDGSAAGLVEGPAAGADSVVLALTPASGTWTATSNDSWLTVTSGSASGTGSANVLFSFTANAGDTRTGTLTVGGQTLTVTQAGSAYVAANPETALSFAALTKPAGVAVDNQGNVYVADTTAGTIQEYTPGTSSAAFSVITLVSQTQILNVSAGVGIAHFAPVGVAVDANGNVYIADSGNNAIQEYSPKTSSASATLATLVSQTSPGAGAGASFTPVGVAVDSLGSVYIADSGNKAIESYSTTGGFTTIVNNTDLTSPSGVAVDVAGNVYISDSGANTIGEYTARAATPAFATLLKASAGLKSPSSLAVDGSGNVYIADTGNNAVKVWSPSTAAVTTLLSTGLKAPGGVAADSLRNVYVADTGNAAVEEIPSAYVNPTAVAAGTAAADSSSLPSVLPTAENLFTPFAPTSSDTSWLKIGTISDGVVSFSYSANSATTSRSAQITLLGQMITVTQPAGSVDVTISSATDIPLTASSYNGAGQTLTITLKYAPAAGTNLTLIQNAGTSFIGPFNNIANGATITLTNGGNSYPFVAWYYGGSTGRDLVLLWPTTKLAAWGYNADGELGNNDATGALQDAPVAVDQAGLLAGKTVVQIARGKAHTLALTSEGLVYAWGNNSVGQLGNNDTTGAQQYAPVAVNIASGTSALFNTTTMKVKTVVAIAAGAYHSLALCSDGSIAAWGYNADGELGNKDNNGATQFAPVAVNMASGTSALAGKSVVAVSAGAQFSMALCSDGTVATWGYNANGQLGNNDPDLVTQRAAVAVNTATGTSALFDTATMSVKTVTAIAAGGNFSLALCSDGTIAAWGENQVGELGTGPSSGLKQIAPVAVNTTAMSALYGKTATAIAAGGNFGLALCLDGTLAAWGNNLAGQLGNGDATGVTQYLPVAVSASTGAIATSGNKAVTAIAAGSDFSLALCSDGTVAAWGDNTYGELGNNSKGTDLYAPAPVDTANTSSVLGRATANSLSVSSQAVHSVIVYAESTLTITQSTANLSQNAQTITITGADFSTTPANDIVTFNLGAIGMVTSASATQLIVTLTQAPTETGALNATVSVDGAGTTGPTEVANIVFVAGPTQTITTPAQNAHLTATGTATTPGTVTFKGAATDSLGVGYIDISLNGGAPQTVTNPATTGPASMDFKWSATLATTPEQGVNTATFTAYDSQGNKSNTLTRSFTFTYSRPALAGGYHGLITAETTSSPLDHNGLLTVTVASTGSFTGRVLLGGASIPLHGVFLDAGAARFGTGLTATLPLNPPGEASLGLLSLNIDVGTGHVITGAITDPTGATQTATIPHADQALYTSAKNPVAPLQNVPLDILNPATDHGHYTAVFQPEAAPNNGTIANQFPQGSGYAHLTVNSAGSVIMVGKLPDGSAVSYSNYLSLKNHLPVFVPLYGVAGFLTGDTVFDPSQPLTDASDAGMLWRKPAGVAKQVYYPSGWPDGIAIDLLASKYIVPASTANALGLTPSSSNTTPNLTIALADGDLTSSTSNGAVIGAGSGITLLSATTGGATSLKAALATSTGLLTGSFTHPLTMKAVSFTGIALQKTMSAEGYFLVIPPTANPQTEFPASGSVVVLPAP